MHHYDPECPARLFCLVSSMSWPQWGLILLKYHLCYILRAADPFAIKCGLVIQAGESYERLDCCVQGQGHSDGSNLHRMFVSPIFSVPLIL